MASRWVPLDMHGKEGSIDSFRGWLVGLYQWIILQQRQDPAFSVQAL